MGRLSSLSRRSDDHRFRSAALCLAPILLCGLALEAGAQDEPPAASDRILVKYKKSVGARTRSRSLAKSRLRTLRKMKRADVSLLEVQDKGRPLKKVLEELRESGLVEYAEPDYVVHALSTFPDDPNFHQQWGLHNTGQYSGAPGADIGAPEGWDIAAGNSPVVVGVIDTGVDYGHEDLVDNMWVNPGETRNGIDDDGNGYIDDIHGIDSIADDGDPMDSRHHGTHVAGTIGATANNGIGIAGVAWNVQIMGLKFLSSTGSGYVSNVIQCLEYAQMMRDEYGVNVVLTNNSWGGGGYSQALDDAIRSNEDSGILFVAAAGNDHGDNDATANYPSAYEVDSLIAVAATGRNDQLANFSNYGAQSVDIAAPGAFIMSTIPGDRYAYLSGTSMAAPHIAGAAAMLFSRYPEATPRAVKELLLATAESVPELDGKVLTGRLDLHEAFWSCETRVAHLTPQVASDFLAFTGSDMTLAASLRDCIAPVDDATVTVRLSNEEDALTLRDDGVAPDKTEGDGTYTATWAPTAGGPVALDFEATFAGGSATARTTGSVEAIPVYELVDDAEFDWVDTSERGERITTLDGDDEGVVVPVGFPFRFFGYTYESMTVSSNGYITFNSIGTAYANASIPSRNAPNPLLLPYWDDFNMSRGGRAYKLLEGEAPRRRVTVSWIDIPYYAGGGTATFQTTLYEEDGSIVFQYLDVDGGPSSHQLGGSASVGIEDASGGLGIQYSKDEKVIDNGSIVVFQILGECEDGVDNDADGTIDFPEDYGCASEADPGETHLVCGLVGLELLIAPLLARVLRRQRRRPLGGAASPQPIF